MDKRYVSVWFRYLNTDWFSLRQPQLKEAPFVLRTPSHGRMVITSVNAAAEAAGIFKGMVLADARAIIPNLEVMDDKPDLAVKLLNRLAEWCIRFSPVVAIDPPDGLLLDASGCSHLWGGDHAYVYDIIKKLRARGYDVQVSMADTPGVAWGVARYGKERVILPGKHVEALQALPPDALRLEPETTETLHRLGLHSNNQFMKMPRSSLRRRFGQHLLDRLDMATGQQMEMLKPVIPVVPFQERLPCMEPIITATGIEIAIRELLGTLCTRLQKENQGLRTARFSCYRTDGKVVHAEIGTNRPSYHALHLFKLFELKISGIDPGPGIELFMLEAIKVEEYFPEQGKMWEGTGGLEDIRLSELLDRLSMRTGTKAIHRFLPSEHYWPERSFRKSVSLEEQPATEWRSDKIRPLNLLRSPEKIEVTAPIPDYPPMLFRYRDKIHKIVRADGPERIEQEWWLQQGQHRDYYYVEDEEGRRYWIFRLGHYDDKTYQWFIHGFCS